MIGQTADTLAGETQPRIIAHTQIPQQGVDRFGPNILGNLDHTDIARLGHDPGHIQHTIIAHIAHRHGGDPHGARTGIHHGRGCEVTGHQAGSHGKGLDRRTGLEHINQRPVTHCRRLQPAAVIRVVTRLIDHGENFTAAHIDNHHGPGHSIETFDGFTQFAMGNILHPQVNRQGQVLTRTGIAHHLYILDQTAAPVLQHLTTARHTLQPVVVTQLQPFLPLFVDIGKTNQMGSHFAGRIKAPVFFQCIDPGHSQGHDPGTILRRHMPAQVNELLVCIGPQASGQGIRIHTQRSGQLGPTLGLLHQMLRIGPQGHHRRTDRQRLTMAIGNLAAVCRNRQMTHAALVTLVFQEALIEHMQIDNAPADQQGSQQQKTRHQTKTPGITTALTRETDHGATMMMSPVCGTRISSSRAARASTRAWAVQVLCSRIKRPHSA